MAAGRRSAVVLTPTPSLPATAAANPNQKVAGPVAALVAGVLGAVVLI